MSEQESLLLVSSPELKVIETSETSEKKPALFGQDKHRFTVVNYQDRYRHDSNKTTDEWDFNVTNTKDTLEVRYSKSDYEDFIDKISNHSHDQKEEDEEDEFDSELFINNKSNLNSIYAKYREAEGQDTITSMSNHAFLKKFEKIKQVSRVPSLKTLNQDLPNKGIIK